MKRFLPSLLLVSSLAAVSALAEDVIHLGNQKFVHYGAVSYMKELAPKYGLRIEEHFFAKGLDIVPAFISGDVDISASAMDGMIAGRAAGAPVFLVAGFAKGGTRIVKRTDLEAKTVAELKGRKIGVARGGAQHLALIGELMNNKLSFSEQPGSDVQILFMNYTDVNQALMQKQIDAMCQAEPYATIAIANGWGIEVMKPYDTPVGECPKVLAMSEKLYRDRPEVAARVLQCFVEATRTFIDNPELAQKYTCETLFKGQVSAELYKQAMENCQYSYDLDEKIVQATIDFMVETGVGKMQKPPTAKEFLRTDLLVQAKQKLGIK